MPINDIKAFERRHKELLRIRNKQRATGQGEVADDVRDELERIAYILSEEWEPTLRRVTLPPGHLLSQVTQFLLPRQAHERYVLPVIQDMRVEYYEALVAGHLWHARWILVRTYLMVVPGWLYAFIACAVRDRLSGK